MQASWLTVVSEHRVYQIDVNSTLLCRHVPAGKPPDCSCLGWFLTQHKVSVIRRFEGKPINQLSVNAFYFHCKENSRLFVIVLLYPFVNIIKHDIS